MALPINGSTPGVTVLKSVNEDPDYIQGAAPGGLVPSEAELPVVSVPGGMPMTLGGYSPDPSRTPQVSTAEDPRSLGVTAPPVGLRK